jgi:hypothetical protein
LPTAWSAETVVKIALFLPLLALAYYFAREASHHSMAAQRAREIDVRLHSIRQYTVESPEADRIAIRAEFARSLFAVLDWGKDNGLEANALRKEKTGMVKAITEAVSGAVGKSKDAH